MAFSLIQALDEFMCREQFSPKREIHYRPSEASVVYKDSNGDKRVAGACLRACYFRCTGCKRTGKSTPYSEWIFALGKAVEEILVEQYKRMGIWVANNVEFYWPEYNISGELDLVLRDPQGIEFIGECCTPSTLLVDQNYCFKTIENFSENDTTIGHTGNINKVQKVFKRNIVDEKVYKLCGKFDGLNAQFTGEHPVLTSRVRVSRFVHNNKKRSYHYIDSEWKLAKDLKRGDYICIPKAKFAIDQNKINLYNLLVDQDEYKYQIVNNYILPLNKPNHSTYHSIPNTVSDLESFYWLIGLYIAEGSCAEGTVYFSLNKDETEIIEKIQSISKELWNLDIAIRPLINYETNELTNGINISISSTALVHLLKSIVPGNTRDRTKHIVYNKISNKLNLLEQILHGAWQGDGCKASEYQYRITTAVHNLAYLYFQIAAYLGLHPRIKQYKQASQFNSDFIYSVEWSKDSKRQNVEPLIDGNDFWCYKIKKIETILYTGPVYNLEVEPDNTYTAGCLAVHNCKSFYGYEANKEICGNSKQIGAPKTSQLLQVLTYLQYFKDRFPYAKMIYYARDSANRAEFDITLQEEAPGKTRPVINGVPDNRFYVENIINRYKELHQAVSQQKVPDRDYDAAYSKEKVEKRYEAGEIGKTKYQDWLKGKEVISDWQCRYCNYMDLCYGNE